MPDRGETRVERNRGSGIFGLLVGLSFVLGFPSAAKVQRFLGTPWLVVFSPGVLLALWVVLRYLTPRVLKRITARGALILAGLTVVFLMVLFALVYPLTHSGVLGPGSDRDEALNAATGELLHGRYPYHVLWKDGGGLPGHEAGKKWSPISPLPGALFFAVPFFLLGNACYQTFFWVMVFFITVRKYFKDGRLSLLSLWILLFLCPVCLHEVVTGGDLLANSLWIFVLTVFLVRCVSRREGGVGIRVLSAVLFGLGMSSRPSFLLIGPLVFSMLIQTAGWKSAVRTMTLAAMVSVAVTLPFYLYDPVRFSALGAIYDKLGRFESILPFAGVLVPGLGMLLAVVLSFQRMDKRGVILFRNCAVVLAWPIVWAVALSSISVGGLEFSKLGWYGLIFVPFGMTACLVPLFERATGRPSEASVCRRSPSDPAFPS